jgi:hypothetical protein
MPLSVGGMGYRQYRGREHGFPGSGAVVGSAATSSELPKYYEEAADPKERMLGANEPRARKASSRFQQSQGGNKEASDKQALPVLCQLVKEHEDKDILTDCCWTLSYISDGSGKKINVLIEQGVIPRLVQLLE